tara:strand:+ start:554 stop:712 length:159 start_codon:yes stop_codon:yes gene_type:complete
MGGEMSIGASSDFYSGNVDAMNDQYSWQYRKSGAVTLFGSSLAMATTALFMA